MNRSLFSNAIRPAAGLLLILEFVSLVASVYAGIAIRFDGNLGAFTEQHGLILPKALVFATVIIVLMLSLGMYQLSHRLYFKDAIARVLVSVVLGSVILSALWFAVPALSLTRGTAPLSVAVSVFCLLSARYLYMGQVDQSIFRRRTLIYGAQEPVNKIVNVRRKADRRGFKIVGLVPANGHDLKSEKYDVIPHSTSLYEIARSRMAEEIVVALDQRRGVSAVDELLEARLKGLDVLDLAAFLERENRKILVDHIKPSWIVYGRGFRNDLLRRATKRVLDTTIAIVALLVVAPVMLVTALLIKLEDGLSAPVLYSQTRVGKHGRDFSILKFRSMRVDAERDGEARWAEQDDPRVTRVGHYIRKCRIDEIPQLFNVLAGSMSLVGPRPERPQFVQGFCETVPYYNERHAVKPGITGWAQLRYQYGSSEQDAVEKLQYDLYYVKNQSLILDLIILLQTVEVILWGKGAR